MDSRRPTYAGPPPPNNHDPRAPPPVPQFAPAQQQHQYQQQHHGPPPPPPPQQQHHQHHQQQHYPPPQHHHAGPPPPSQPQAQPPPQHYQQQQQQQQLPQPIPPPYSGASNTSVQGTHLPPIQQAAQGSSSEPQHSLPPLNPLRQPSAPPAHDPRDAAPPYHSDPYHNRSGHATPAPVNRSYSHDSGQQRTPATPTGPPAFSHPPGPEGAQQPPPGPPPPPQPMDHGHHPYPPPTNGVQHHGLPHHPPSHHEPHPQYAMTPMMDQHHSYPPPGQSMYQQPQTYGPASANIYGPKRKQMRATQACEQCRQRKQKCDEGSPCSFCKENSLSCQYRDTPPAKTDKNMEKLLTYMETNSNQILALTAKIDSIDNRLRRIESTGPQPRQSNHDSQQAYTEAGAEMGSEIATESAPARPQLDEDHRTAPHKLLLLWPSVRPLLQDAGVELNDGYVMEAEDRGILRLWTRGEGIDENDGTQPGGPASPARSDESGEAGSASTPSAEGIWGVGFTYPSTPNSDARTHPYGAGGLKANGEVDLDANTVNSLYESYMRNLHVMHPFLDRRRLRKMFDTFIKRYSTGRPRAAFAVGTEYGERPLKRQRSNGSTANIGGTGSDGEMRREQTERSPANGIIFLVLALGKICLHKEPLPGLVADSKLQINAFGAHNMTNYTANSPLTANAANAKNSPMSPSSALTPANTQPTPPSEANMHIHNARSRRSSIDGSSPSSTPGPRNMDVLPGLAYFAKAAEILGDQADGNDLCHAQMFLLAGLYKGQLARVKESMSWFTMAGRACRILLDRYKLWNSQYWGDHSSNLRSNFIHSQSRIKDTRQSLIVLASWSCLQLESDILAELPLPDSRIQSVEHLLIMPHKVADDETYSGLDPLGRPDNYDDLLIYYSAQMFLRRKLNQIHRELYGKDSMPLHVSAVVNTLQDHDSILQTWREGLPPHLRWNDDDPPPSDILNARLRAKYWGARYVANRPYLDYTLHIMPHVSKAAEPHVKSIVSVAKDAYGNPRDKADVHIFKAIQMIGDREAWEGSKRCIEAAMHSTVAFDGIKDRLIVTNIHGTAHAQFGNMLVLSAVYNSVLCKPLVNEERFKGLLQRTIGFLRRLRSISPTCVHDCQILEKFQNTFFGGEPDKSVYAGQGIEPNSATNSFNNSNPAT